MTNVGSVYLQMIW